MDLVRQSVDIDSANVRGPVPMAAAQIRYLVSCTKAQAPALVAAFTAATAVRSAKHKGAPVNIKIDPRDI
jgi:hypothetical protein